jgi:hypothetical protein
MNIQNCMPKVLYFLYVILLGCGDWGGGEVGRTSCSFGSFGDFLPNAGKAVKMATGNNGNELYILDDSYYVHSYKRDNLYECAFNLKSSEPFSGFPNDVISSGGNFYVQDKTQLKSYENIDVCKAKDGVFAINGNELAVGSTTGIEIWSINPCVKKADISSQRVLALAVTNSEYFAAEGISTEPRNLTRYPKDNSFAYSEPMSSIPGNEKNFCSADRIAVNNWGVYLLDKKCKKIGIFGNDAIWRKTISLDSLGIRTPLDIGAGEYSHIFIMHPSGVEKVNVF